MVFALRERDLGFKSRFSLLSDSSVLRIGTVVAPCEVLGIIELAPGLVCLVSVDLLGHNTTIQPTNQPTGVCILSLGGIASLENKVYLSVAARITVCADQLCP